MDEETALLRAICAQPDEDTSRLAFADWLEEHAGDVPGRDPHEMCDRAEFIRLQCALDADRPRTWSPLRQEREKRGEALLTAHREEWEAPLLGLGVIGGYVLPQGRPSVTFRRGFPEQVRMSADDFIHHGERLFQLAPVTAVVIAQPHDLTPRELEDLTASPHLANLTTLTIGHKNLNNAGAHVLAASPHLANLRNLILRNNEISEGGAHALLSSPHLGHLTTLDLSHNQIAPLTTRDIKRVLQARRKAQDVEPGAAR